MSKRNISYIKPQDPSFLRRIKEQIGYKEGPTIEEKRQKLENLESNSSDVEGEDEQPQVVVLKEGDLTAEEADVEKKRTEKEENEKPADLSQRIIFKLKTKKTVNNPEVSSTLQKTKKSTKTESKQSKSKLSFNNSDESEQD